MEGNATLLPRLAAAISVVGILSGFSAQVPATAPAPTPTKYTLVTEPSAGLSSIYTLISSAKKTIDMTMYELTDSTVTSELATAAGNGVVVRVILDQNSEKQSNTTAYNYLASHKVSVHWANPTYAVTHQKTITVDQATTAIMTFNLTPQDYATTRDLERDRRPNQRGGVAGVAFSGSAALGKLRRDKWEPMLTVGRSFRLSSSDSIERMYFRSIKTGS